MPMCKLIKTSCLLCYSQIIFPQEQSNDDNTELGVVNGRASLPSRRPATPYGDINWQDRMVSSSSSTSVNYTMSEQAEENSMTLGLRSQSEVAITSEESEF